MFAQQIGFGNRNKAEALFLLRGHEPLHRKYSDGGRPCTTDIEVFGGAHKIADMLEWLLRSKSYLSSILACPTGFVINQLRQFLAPDLRPV
jgi:hypothetical protein